MNEYEEVVKRFVAPGLMEGSLVEFARRLRAKIQDEHEKPSPDNALIALLCDAARVGRELIQNDKRFA